MSAKLDHHDSYFKQLRVFLEMKWKKLETISIEIGEKNVHHIESIEDKFVFPSLQSLTFGTFLFYQDVNISESIFSKIDKGKLP